MGSTTTARPPDCDETCNPRGADRFELRGSRKSFSVTCVAICLWYEAGCNTERYTCTSEIPNQHNAETLFCANLKLKLSRFEVAHYLLHGAVHVAAWNVLLLEHWSSRFQIRIGARRVAPLICNPIETKTECEPFREREANSRVHSAYWSCRPVRTTNTAAARRASSARRRR